MAVPAPELDAARAREMAWAYHETLLEILRRLNQAEEERVDPRGLEFVELERMMSRFWAIEFAESHMADAMELLQENGLLEQVTDPHYAWDRQRIVGRWYRITALGKSYLARSIEDDERIR